MVEKMTEEESRVQRAIRAARLAKQALLAETGNAFELEDETEVVKVKRPKAEKVTTKVPNQKKEGYGLAGVEEEYKIKKEELDTRDLFDMGRFEDMETDDLVEYAKDKVEGFDREELIKFMKNW